MGIKAFYVKALQFVQMYKKIEVIQGHSIQAAPLPIYKLASKI